MKGHLLATTEASIQVIHGRWYRGRGRGTSLLDPHPPPPHIKAKAQNSNILNALVTFNKDENYRMCSSKK
jgi:hypothetical protein